MKYSQNNEEEIILHYFGSHLGNFLDIGANDGETLSNSRALALKGWRGVCGEPAPEAYRKLSNMYLGTDVLVLNVAITDKAGEIPFFDMGPHLGNGDTSLLATTKESETKRWLGVKFGITNVEAITYQDITERCNRQYDFITIDAEGQDWTILQQIDLTNTQCVCIEHNGNEHLYNAIKNYCNGYGLNKCLLNNLENVIWAR